MKILHICSNYTDTMLYQKLNDELKKKNINQTFIVPNSYSAKCNFELNSNVKILKCYPKWLRIAYHIKQFVIRKAINKIIDVSEYDVIHAHLLFTNGYLAYQIKKTYGIPYIVAVRNTDINDFFKYMKHLRSLGIKILQEADKIIFLSKAYYDQMIEKYIPKDFENQFRAKSVVIPNGIDNFWLDNKYYKKTEPKNQRINLIYAGRIDKNKNIDTTLNVIKHLEKSGIKTHLDIIGKVEDKTVYTKIINDEKTTYYMPMNKEKLINMYRKNDIFIMPSFHETFGLVYAEAMSQGLPVIYSKNQGFDGQFEDGKVGYAVNPYDADNIATKIKNIIKNYKDISKNASEKSSKYNWSDIADCYINIYCEVMK